MPNPTEPISSSAKEYRQSIEKNISQTKITLDQIKQYENSNILPFSLKQHFKVALRESPPSNNECRKLAQSNLSQKLNRLTSRNTSSFAPQSHKNQNMPVTSMNFNRQKPNMYQNQHNLTSEVAKNSTISQNQENNQGASNHIHSMQSQKLNKIQVQIHLTIAKKKFTLKLLNLINSKQLSDIVETFLIDNEISNPSKKSHLKTKNSIIQMVEQKLYESKIHSHQNLLNSSPFIGLKAKSHEQSPSKGQAASRQENQKQEFQEIRKSPQKHTKISKNSRKLEKPIFKDKSSLIEDFESQSEEGCSPSFKESEYIWKSPITKTSSFSPEPKHKENRYEKLVANYYHDQILQKSNSFVQKQPNNHAEKEKPYHKLIHLTNQLNLKTQQDYLNKSNLQNFHSIQNVKLEQASTPKSVYEKWKQKEKSKDYSKPSNQSFSNALKERKIQQNLQKNKKNNSQQFKQKQTNCHMNICQDLSQNKWIWKLNHTPTQNDSKKSNSKSIKPDNSQTKIRNKQNKNRDRSPLNTKNNHPHPSHQTNTPNKHLNKTQFINNRTIVSDYSSHYAHPNQFVSEVSPLKPLKSVKSQQKSKPCENPNTSKVYTVHDEQFPTGELSAFEMSLDHFYKQGLVFEAKKQQQISQKFKSIYPFTTRAQQIQYKSRKTSEVSSNHSREKYFSFKIASKSSANIALGEREKSALHERLYKEDKEKKMKHIEIEANKKIFKIAKTPTPQIQINLMQENLKQIKGLSQEKKMKLIERNIQIKQKIREKDKIIDEELDNLIKEGKVRPTCEIVTIRKSPFRKTQVF